jgi:hypothetical protein
MVGGDEGVISDALAMMLIGVFLVTVCAVLGLRWRSRVAGVAGLFLAQVTAFLFQPWTAFTLEPADDSDAQSLQATYLFLARWWVAASVAAVAGAIGASLPRRVYAMALRNLTADDLRCCPVWRYQGQSDDTASVWPASGFEQPDREVYIARTRFVLADGSRWWGYCSPGDDSDLDSVQPVLLAPGGPVHLWDQEQQADPEPARACRLLGKRPEQVFPARFECVVPFQGRCVSGELRQQRTAPTHPGR